MMLLSHLQRLPWLPVRGRHRALLCSPMTSSGGDGLPSSLWRRNRKQAALALYQPFVVSLAAGSLPIHAFRHYITQDAFFLQAFADVYNLTLANVDDDLTRLMIHQLRQGVLDELKLHSSFLQAWGVDIDKEIKPNEAAVRYTDFLRATAVGQDYSIKRIIDRQTPLKRRKLAALTIGAMVPCMRLYAYLGQEISKCMFHSYNKCPYQEWVDTYSSEAFQESTCRIEELLKKLSESLCGEEEFKLLHMLYAKAMDLEIDFFSAQPNCDSIVPIFRSSSPSNVLYLLVSDFDSTCSTMDSCLALETLSIKSAENARISSPQIFCTEMREKWDILKNLYNEQYTQLLEAYPPEKKLETFDYDGLMGFLGQLSLFEMEANQKVVESGVLQGLDLNDVKKAGAKMQLQEGCAIFFESVPSNVTSHIISVCWSSTFIEGAFSSDGGCRVVIHANELKESGGITLGDIERRIETPLDKGQVFAELLKDGLSRKVISIYIGDSITDLVCLLNADLGIVVGSSASLRRVTEAFGIQLVPLYHGVLERQYSMTECGGWKKSTGVLYSVNDWHEIHACLIGNA